MTDATGQLREALLTIRELRARLDRAEGSRAEPIAIVGMACRFPGGATSPARFWDLLAARGDAVTEVPSDRWPAEALYDPDPEASGRITTTRGAFLDDVDRFDADFFSIAPREAAQMDPQQRLLLEVAWEALEDAGQTMEALAGTRGGVFVGVHSQSSDYMLLQADSLEAIDTYTATGTAHSVIAGRLAYALDLRGPALVIDTACSSSLVAAHVACQSLRDGDCDLAVVGGVNLMVTPHVTTAAARMQLLSPDGRCKAFDARGDGLGRGEGCGVVVLKRLTDAQRDGDAVLALIRGSAVNQDGASNGLTAPSGVAQEVVVAEALRRAGVEPRDISHVETHGTGTSLGDPIELESLMAVLGTAGPPCVLGAVKTNIGHLEGAAGIAGLIKVVLSLQAEALPPLVHFERLNPLVSLDGSRFAIPTELVPWRTGDMARRAGVSSFGFSGTNAHVVVEEAPPGAPLERRPPRRRVLLPVSARSRGALRELAQAYAGLLEGSDDDGLADVIAAAALRRSALEHRLAVVGSSGDEIAARLASFAAGSGDEGVAVGTVDLARSPGVVFVFPGQGSQRPGMGLALAAAEPVFAEALERCEEAFRAEVDWSLRDMLASAGTPSRLDEIDVVQPALFALQVALAELWRSWGIMPSAVVGHSMGEVAAAHVAGALTLEDAARVICVRSRLLRSLRGKGAMAVVGLPAAEVEHALAGRSDELSVAVVNGPRSTVISGDPAALTDLLAELADRDVFCRAVNVDVASHSPQVDPLLPELQRALDGLAPRAAGTPMLSTVTGASIGGAELDGAYWCANLRRPVRFFDVVQALVERRTDAFVELSAHPILLTAVEEAVHAADAPAVAVPSLERDRDEEEAMLRALGSLFAAGCAPDWRRLGTVPAGRRVALPAYPWQRTRHWIDAGPSIWESRHAGDEHPVLGRELELAHDPTRRVWQRDASTGVDWVALATAAAEELWGAEHAHRVVDISVGAPFVETSARELQISASAGSPGTAAFAVHSRSAGEAWTLRAEAELVEGAAPADWLYEVVWREVAPPAPGVAEPGRWLLLGDRGGVADELAAALRRAGHECVVAPAPDAGEAAAIARHACTDILTEEASWRGVVDLWPLDVADDDDPGSAGRALVLDPAIAALDVLAGRAEGATPGLVLVTRGAQDVGAGGELGPAAGALAWGAGRVAALERADLVRAIVDLDPQRPSAEALAAELLGDGAEDQVVLRDGRRYVPRLVRLRDAAAATPLEIRVDATYLVTGGLGGIGLELARWLVERGARNLVLVGRRGLTDDGSRASRRKAAVEELRATGASIDVAAVDVADPGATRALLAALRQRRAPLAGVLHAAGVVAVRPLGEAGDGGLDAVVDPKVTGAWTLHELTRDLSLDFFVCFSSGAGVWGSSGLAHYGAANAFLDAVAVRRRALGLPALSVAWGWWASEDETPTELAAGFAQVGLRPMRAGAAIAALEHLLSTGRTLAVVADADLETFGGVLRARRERPLLSELAAVSDAIEHEPEADGLRADLIALDPGERRLGLAELVRSEVASVLGLGAPEHVGPRTGFARLGMDSLMAVRLRGRLQQVLGLRLPPTLAFEYPTVEQLAVHLAAAISPLDGAPEEPPEADGAVDRPERDEYSEDELVALLARKLEEIG